MASPSLQNVTVSGGTVTLPFLRYRAPRRSRATPASSSTGYLSNTVTVPAGHARGLAERLHAASPAAGRPAGSVYTGGYTEPVASTPAGHRGA